MTKNSIWAAVIIIGLYLIWLYHSYQNPPIATCLLQGCHFTVLGWSAGQ